MGIIAVAIAVIAFWFFVGKRHALLLVGIVVLGIWSIATNPDRNHCEGSGRMWMCHLQKNVLW